MTPPSSQEWRRTKKPFDEGEREEWKSWLKTQLKKKKKTMIMEHSHITSCQIDGEKIETMADFIFLGATITADSDYSDEIRRCLLLERKL